MELKDASNCIQQAAAIVTVPTDPAPVINTPTVVDACVSEGNFSINVTLATAGIGPYQVSINGGAFQNIVGFPYTTPSDLSSGNYTINVRDANGCTTGNQGVTIRRPLTYGASVTTQPSCTNPGNIPTMADGVITLTPNGGSGAQTYELWDAANTTQIATATVDNVANTISTISAGSYTIRVIDTDVAFAACPQLIPITLAAPAIPTLNTPLVTNILCNGEFTGSITAQLDTSGVLNPVYQYALFDISGAGANNRALQNSPTFSNLPAGNYEIEVLSGRNCTNVPRQAVTISQPAAPLGATAMTSPFTCTTSNDPGLATITVTATGGTSGATGYLFSYDGGSFISSNTIQLPYSSTAQEIIVLVRDSNGCQEFADDGINIVNSITIPPAQKVTAGITNPTASQLSCTVTEDIVITIADGSGNYTVTEQPSGTIIATPGNIQLNAPGLYTYLITDNTTSCTTTVSYNVDPFDEGTVSAITLDNVSCDGFLDGDLQIDVQGYTGVYNYTVIDLATGLALVSPNATGSGTAPGTQDILNLPAGSYRVEIAQGAFPNCDPVSSGLVSIAPPPAPLTVMASRTNDPTCIPGTDGQITAAPRGGWGGYEYQLEADGAPNVAVLGYDFASNGNNLVFSNLPAGDYVVRVRDANGCTEPPSNVVNIPTANIITATGAVTNQLVCFGDTNAEITITRLQAKFN